MPLLEVATHEVVYVVIVAHTNARDNTIGFSTHEPCPDITIIFIINIIAVLARKELEGGGMSVG